MMAIPIEIDIDEMKEDDADGDSNAKKGGGLLITGAGAVVAALIAAGGAFFLAPSASDAATDTPENAKTETASSKDEKKADTSHTDKKEKQKKAAKKKKPAKKGDPNVFDGGKVTIEEDIAFLILDPMVISIQPIGSARHLRISLVIETSAEDAPALTSRIYHLRDVLNGYLRSVNRDVFEDPAEMARIRAQLHRRIEVIATDIDVHNVLITEFVLT